jgi:hypothetical protein
LLPASGWLGGGRVSNALLVTPWVGKISQIFAVCGDLNLDIFWFRSMAMGGMQCGPRRQ